MPRRWSGAPTSCPSSRISPALGMVKPADHAHQRGLAAARRAEKDDELAVRNGEIEGRLDHRQVAEALGDAVEDDIVLPRHGSQIPEQAAVEQAQHLVGDEADEADGDDAGHHLRGLHVAARGPDHEAEAAVAATISAMIR